MTRLPGGLNHLFQRIIFSILGHGKWFLKNCISFSWSEEIIVIGYNLISFLHSFMENTSDFQNRFSIHIVFRYQSKIIRVIELKKKRINFLFIAVIYFPLSIEMNILTLYYICYVILAMYVPDQELSYNLSKNLSLLPRIL